MTDTTKADPATIAAVVATLRERADRVTDSPVAAMELNDAADALLAAHPDAERWAMELAEAVRRTCAERVGIGTGACSKVLTTDLAAIVRNKLGGR